MKMTKFAPTILVVGVAMFASADDRRRVAATATPVSRSGAEVPVLNATSASHAGNGMVIHIDPATGVTNDPTPGEVRDILEASFPDLNTSTEGLVEVPSPVAGGGVMVDLKGRFQHAMIAEVRESGEVHSLCGNEAPPRPSSPRPRQGE